MRQMNTVAYPAQPMLFPLGKAKLDRTAWTDAKCRLPGSDELVGTVLTTPMESSPYSLERLFIRVAR